MQNCDVSETMTRYKNINRMHSFLSFYGFIGSVENSLISVER
jgi:hypothetical protein